jgi:hypothetical protein
MPTNKPKSQKLIDAAPSFSEGGAGTSKKIKNALVPVNMRTYINHLLGDRSPITESDFTEKDLDAIRYAIKKDEELGEKSSGTIGYGDYSPQGFSNFGNPGEGPLDILKDSYTDPAYRMETTLGGASYRQLPDGSYVVEDQYNFNAPSRESVNDFLKDKNIVSAIYEGYKGYGLAGVLNLLGNVYGDTESESGAPVSIRLPRSVKTSARIRDEELGMELPDRTNRRHQKGKTLPKKKTGGSIGYRSGGSVKSSASKRADGCAQRGKTRGKMV